MQITKESKDVFFGSLLSRVKQFHKLQASQSGNRSYRGNCWVQTDIPLLPSADN